MAVIGSAHIVIRALTNQLEKDISAGLTKAIDSAAQKAGQQAAERFGYGFNQEIQDQIDVSGVLDGADRAFGEQGRDSGRSYIDGAVGEMDRGSSRLDDAVEDAADSARRAAARGNGGNGGILGIIIGNERSNRSGQGLRRAVLQLDALAAVAGAAVGALASLASSLFAVGAAAAQAAPALIALPGALLATIQAAGGVILAFKGVGEAYKLGTQAATNAGTAAASNAGRQAASAKAIRAAQEALGDTVVRVSRDIADAQQSVADAEADLAGAQTRSKRAQDALNAARLEGLEQLEDLQFAVRGGALAEEQAILDLEEAMALYNRLVANGAPAESRQFREADLARKEAILQLDIAKDRNSDLAKEQEYASRTGVEGTEAMIDARNDEISALNDVADAQRELADAQQELTRAQVDGAQDIIRAQRAVAEAGQSGAAGVGATNAALDKYNAALAKLTPAQRRFIAYLRSTSDEFKVIKTAAADGLFNADPDGGFGGLESSLRRVVESGFLQDVADGLELTTRAVGRMFDGLSLLTTDPFFRGNFSTLMTNNASVVDTLGRALVALVGYLTAVFAAAGPVTQRFADWIETLALARQEGLDTEEEMTALEERFNSAGDVAAQLGEIFGNLWETLKNLGNAASGPGQLLLDKLEETTDRWANLNDEVSQGLLSDYFQGAAENTLAILSLLGELTKILFSFGDNPAVGAIAEQLETELLPILEDILTHGLEELGPALVDTIVALAEAFKALSETGALEAFLGVLEGFANIIVGLMENPLTAKLLTWLIVFEATLGALALIRNFSGIGLLVGFIGKLGKPGLLTGINTRLRTMLGLQTATAAAGTGAAAAGAAGAGAAGAGAAGAGAAAAGTGAAAALGPILLVVAAIAALVGILVAAYKNSEDFRKVVDTAWAAIQKAVSTAWNDYIQPALVAFAKFVGDTLATGLLFLWQNVVVPASQGIQRNLTIMWAVVKPALEAFWDFTVNVLAPALVFLWQNVIVPAFEAIGKVIGFAWNSIIKPIFEALWFIISNVIIPVIKFLWKNVIEPAFKGISTAISIAWNIIKFIFDLIKFTIEKVLAPIFNWLWKNVIEPVFKAIGDVITTTWNNVIKPIFEALGGFIENTVAPAFQRGVGIISSAWESIKSMAAKPINFIIETVYTKGIKAVFDKVAEAIGSTARLPSVSPINEGTTSVGNRGSRVQARARGGYTPPGLTLVGEKGPEFINMNRSGWVYNASTTKAMQKAVGGDLSLEGVVGSIAKAKDWVLGNLSKAAKKLIDPLLEVMNRDKVGGTGMFGEIARGTFTKIANNIIGYAGKNDMSEALSGGEFPRSSTGWPAPVRGRLSPNTAAARSYIAATFGIENIGGLGQRANKSDHPMGKALDAMISGWQTSAGISLGNRVADYFIKNPKAYGTKYVIWRDRINSGSGWRPYVHPSGNTTNPTLRHMDHVHLSLFDKGGMLNSGSAALNLSGAPERILTSRQNNSFERLVERSTSLSAEGLTIGEQAIINALKESGGRGTQMTINPPPETDIVTLARLVARELEWNQR